MGKVIKVGMADLNVCVSPDSITTLGLGSCVGIAFTVVAIMLYASPNADKILL